VRGRASHEALVKDLAGEPDVLEHLTQSGGRLLEYLPATGFALWIDGVFAAVGETPAEVDVRRIVQWLNGHGSGGLFHTHCLSDHYPPAAAFTQVAAGMLALSVSRSPRDYLIWFRAELLHTVEWAGDPTKPVIQGEDGVQLSPRKSFAAWRQQVSRQAQPWSTEDVKMAESLRISLLEVVLEHVDQLARERQRARLQQDALVAQLDDKIVQWERTAAQLKVESDRRAILEDELSQVLRRTVIEQEAERQRIARELHDSLGQYLTAMQLDLDGIARDGGVTAAIKARIDRLKVLTADAGQEVNHLAWEIRPTALDDLGLQTALQQLVEEWTERSGLAFDLHLTLDNRRLPAAVESVLYRVLQEAILNVVKHAEARRVGIILEASKTEVSLIVEDDGKGFLWTEESAKPSTRLGILGMRERLALVGGSLEIESSPGRGATLIVHVPL
jgi:signal transduction histidine kinase